jgi:cytochrome bd ubiquinol oxidase subunit II
VRLQESWFGIIGVLFLGFFILEGFDFGVGMLMEPLARVGMGQPEPHRRTVLNTIGPVWDGNEVWLITGGAAMFAAFPGWYATVFSTLYLPLLAILFGMILRSVSIEWRGKVDDSRWRAWADFGIAAGSWLPAVLWGVAFAILVRGLPVDASGHVDLSITDVLNAYTLLGGLATGGLFLLYGAVFIALKTAGTIRDDAHRFAVWLSLPVTALVAGFGLWTQLAYGKAWTWLVLAGAGCRGGGTARGSAVGVAAHLRRLGVRVRCSGSGGRRCAVVRRSLPEPGALDAEQAMERDDLQRLVDPIHPQGHDVGDGVHGAADSGLPGLDVLGFPATNFG